MPLCMNIIEVLIVIEQETDLEKILLGLLSLINKGLNDIYAVYVETLFISSCTVNILILLHTSLIPNQFLQTAVEFDTFDHARI